MPNVELHDALTPVPGVTGAAGYHAILTTNEGQRITWFVPSMSGRTAEAVAAGLGFTVEFLVIDVWQSQGVGQPYTWNEAAIAALEEVGLRVADDAEEPSLAPGEDGVYVVSKTWLRANGHDYIPNDPFDIVLILPNFSSSAGVVMIADIVQSLFDGTYGDVRTAEGVVRQGRPPRRLVDVTLCGALLAIVGNLPDLFGTVAAAERLRLIIQNLQVGTFAPVGLNAVGTNPEVEVRDALLEALGAGIDVLTNHFANAVDGDALTARLEALRMGHTSGVVAGAEAHDHLNQNRWRSLFCPIFLDLLSIYASALG